MEIPKFATLQYDIRLQLGISWAEYVLCDMIYHLSRDRWCNKKIAQMSEDMGLTKRGTIKMLGRLIEKGLLEKSSKGYRTLSKYHDTKINRGGGELSSPKTENDAKKVNKVHSRGELSSTLGELSSKITDARITENYNKKRGYELFKEKRKALNLM